MTTALENGARRGTRSSVSGDFSRRRCESFSGSRSLPCSYCSLFSSSSSSAAQEDDFPHQWREDQALLPTKGLQGTDDDDGLPIDVLPPYRFPQISVRALTYECCSLYLEILSLLGSKSRGT